MLAGCTIPEGLNQILFNEQGIELGLELLIGFEVILIGCCVLNNHWFIFDNLIFKVFEVMAMPATNGGLVIDRHISMVQKPMTVTEEAFKDMIVFSLTGDVRLRYTAFYSFRDYPVRLDGNLYWLGEPYLNLPIPGQFHNGVPMGQATF
jgi:hypothetical protein